MTVHAQHVEPSLEGDLDIAGDLGRRSVSKIAPGRGQVGALQENPLPVDRPDEVMGAHLAKAGAQHLRAEWLSLDLDADGEVVKGLFAEPNRPPQLRVGHDQAPPEAVRPQSERMLLVQRRRDLVVASSAHLGAERDRHCFSRI